VTFVIEAIDPADLATGFGERRSERGSENGKDRNGDHQIEEGEGAMPATLIAPRVEG
jgi:hypothetical protein